jgi:transposase-like protein
MEAGDETGVVMSEKKRKVFSGEFKAKVALDAVRGVKTANEIAQGFGVHPTQVGQWKRELQERAGSLFEAGRGPKPVGESASPERLCSEIGRLKRELDWLKKKSGTSPWPAASIGSTRMGRRPWPANAGLRVLPAPRPTRPTRRRVQTPRSGCCWI